MDESVAKRVAEDRETLWENKKKNDVEYTGNYVPPVCRSMTQPAGPAS